MRAGGGRGRAAHRRAVRGGWLRSTVGVPASEIGHPDHGRVWLDVNGSHRQQGDLNQLIWKVPEMISHLSGLFRLQPGDLIMSGTPAGVGPVQRGDALHGGVEGVGEIALDVV